MLRRRELGVVVESWIVLLLRAEGSGGPLDVKWGVDESKSVELGFQMEGIIMARDSQLEW